MKSLKQAFVWLAVLHFIALIGLVAWLAGTERINTQRVTGLTDLFALTITQEKDQQKAQAMIVEREKAKAESIARRNGTGPAPIAEELEDEDHRNELTLQKLDRKEKEIESLQRSLYLKQQLLEKEKQDVVVLKADVDARLAAIQQKMDDEGFQKAVMLFEGIPAKQTKQLFMQLISSNQIDQVVSYLDAMKSRKATSVLKEFKTADEITAVVELTERLRARGSDLIAQVENTQ